jgi:hypothetical protein
METVQRTSECRACPKEFSYQWRKNTYGKLIRVGWWPIRETRMAISHHRVTFGGGADYGWSKSG